MEFLKRFVLLTVVALFFGIDGNAQCLYTGNPIVPNIGLDDGHMRVYGDRIYNDEKN